MKNYIGLFLLHRLRGGEPVTRQLPPPRGQLPLGSLTTRDICPLRLLIYTVYAVIAIFKIVKH